MDNNFFNFIKPYLSWIDSGLFFRRPFSWLYGLFAILNLVLPIYVFIKAIDNRIFDASGKFVFVFLVVLLIIVFACWVGFQLWWDRMGKVINTSVDGDDFVSTPVFSHFIQTLGEWVGTWIGIVGFGSALLASIILGEDSYRLSNMLGLDFLTSGFIGVLLMPILGFLIVVITRFFAEQFRALSSIANNTRRD